MDLKLNNTACPVPVNQCQAEPANVQASAAVQSWPTADQLVCSVKSPKLVATFDALPSSGAGSAKARILSKNLDAWNARWEMVNGAKSSIDVSYFSFEKDVFGIALLGGLLKKQAQGVKVRLMTDAMADTFGERGFKMPLRGKDYLQELVGKGGEAYIYNPLWKRPKELLQSGYAALSSNHDKILVVDGQKGITGGRNIGIDYLTEAVDRPGAWRDMDVELEGPGPAKGLTAAFDAELGEVARPVKKDRLGNWSKKDIELIGAHEMMNFWLNDPALSADEKTALRKDPVARQKLAADLVKRAVAQLHVDLPNRTPDKGDLKRLNELATELVNQLEARGSRSQYLANRVAARDSQVKILDQTSEAATLQTPGMGQALKKLVESAQERIVIENPYVVLTEEMLQALEQASARGVKIDIITNSPLSTDSSVTQAFFLEDWKMVLARCPNARIYVATGDRKFHTKSAVADGEVSFISTYNLDLLSGHVNSEVGAAVKSKEVASDLLKAFDDDLKDPQNGFLEYTIQKDADGKAVLKDGKPIQVFGPENHLSADMLETYRKKRKLWGQTLRDHIPYLKPLRHPETLKLN